MYARKFCIVFLSSCCVFGPGLSVEFQAKNNVCRHLTDYRTINENKNCYFNPDLQLPLWVIAKRYGYYLAKYEVVSEDGYYLTLHRLLHHESDFDNRRTPIFLQHGVSVSAGFWMMIGNNSLDTQLFVPAFNLLNDGYDVWMANSRGTVASFNHTKYKTDSDEYWNFSFHEMGLYDIPVFIDMIRSKSKSGEKVIYLGHSMGTTISYIYASMRREHAQQNIKAIISVAPIAFMNIQNIRIAVKPLTSIVDELHGVIRGTGLDAAFRGPRLLRVGARKMCTSAKFLPLCERVIETFTGLNPEQLAPEYVPMFFRFFFEQLSLKTLVHYSQIIKNNGAFRQFDYGKERNRILYGSEMPPEYQIGNIAQPVHLLVGRDDFLSDVLDCRRLYDKLTSRKSFHIVNENGRFDFAHNDFVMGKHVNIFYRQLKEVLEPGNLLCC